MTRTSVRIGFDAWGSIARTHVQGLKALPVVFPDLPFRPVLAGVATRNPARNGEWIREAGFENVYGSAAELVADVDAIDICTPNALHVETAIAAWQAGKAVYCEKPLAESLAAARRMAEVAAAAPGASQVAFTMRFWPAVARAKDLLAAGRLGRILSVRGRMVHGGYLDPNRAYSWRLDRGLAGGGALADLGIHIIDMVHFLLGPMTDVRGRTRTFIEERPVSGGGRAKVEVDDWAELTCTLAESGAVGTIEATRGGDGQEESTLEIFGSEGSLRISSAGAQLFPQWFDRTTGALHTRINEPAGPYLKALLGVMIPARQTMGSFVDSHAASLHWWLRRICDPDWAATQPPLAATIADALAAQEVMAAVYGREA